MKLERRSRSKTMKRSLLSGRSINVASLRTMEGEQTLRLLRVAAETGARFVRERIDVEPIDWLHSPLLLFDGLPAIQACREPEGFRRAIALHGLAIGLDASPQSLRGIPAQEFLQVSRRMRQDFSPGADDWSEEWQSEGPNLYTCSIISDLADRHIQIFCAMIARGPGEVRVRLRQRFGPLLESEAQVRLGFDWSEPLACALVSGAVADMLLLAAEEPTSSLAEGLDFQVEQRFAS